MAVDAETKKAYNNQIADQKKSISEIDKDLAAYKRAMAQNKKLKPFFHIGMTSRLIDQANLYMDMNDLSEQMMSMKNSGYLDNSKKLLGRIFTELEAVVTGEDDEPLEFNRERLNAIKPFNPRQRLNLYKHITKLIRRLIDSYGPNTKWKWSFPDYWGKAAVILKNFTDYREIQAVRDPREEFYYDRQELLTTVKDALMNASNEFRDKFELSTKQNSDLLRAIRLLEVLRRICSLTGDDELMKKSKAGIEAYRARIESEEDKDNKKKKK
ncbi:MAG: hypothetical protein KDK41_13765 [Leptospiraceae bacterium]|nr:hypothetical protein [Leptospiraceae bacterium]MCB1201709.1 hypothetical protein [Leptospiraceae bacterium]